MVRFAGEHGLEGVDERPVRHPRPARVALQLRPGPGLAGGVAIDPAARGASTTSTSGSAEVDGGVLWSELFDAAAPLGLTPPVLTDYMHLSVGGTLSVGGIGGATSRFGTQADNVLRPAGDDRRRADRINCSRRRRPEVFHAVLAGLGQCRDHPARHRPAGRRSRARPGSSTCSTTTSAPTWRTSCCCCASCASTTWRARSCATPATPAGATRSRRPPTSRRPRRPTTPPCWRGCATLRAEAQIAHRSLPGLRLPARPRGRLHQEPGPLGHRPTPG